MSAPTKAEQLESFAGELGMTELELVEFCLEQIVAHCNGDHKVSAAYLRETLYNHEWVVRELFIEQAWDLPGTIGFFSDCITAAAEQHRKFDT